MYTKLPMGDAPAALQFPHFPTLHQALIWRNWNLVSIDRLAKVLRTEPENVIASAEAMGLVRDDSCLELWKQRGFQTIIRRNWELLNYDQMLELLDWTEDELAFTLKEDDFFFHKLGLHKPVCQNITYRELSEAEKQRTAEICKTVTQIRNSLPEAIEKPFQFLENYGNMEPYPCENADDFRFKFIYSYSALYGDALVDDELASYPEALFKDYEASGVEGVWLQGILYKLVPWLGEDLPLSAGWQKRLRNLRKLSERAGRHNVKIYLYLNEPRSMQPDFFEKHPDWRGVAGPENDFALCTSAPGVLEALSKGIEMLAREVPQLGGIFNITQSENLTHCRSRGGCCPRCESHSAAELISEVNRAFYDGLKKAGTGVQLIAYSWAWKPEWQDEIIARLGDGVAVMAVSEDCLPTDCFGFKSQVCDYTISKIGPSEISKNVWSIAHAHNHPCVAKIQTNVSWELSPVPYLPVPYLVERHLKNLRACGVDGLMLGWTHGGAPGGNLPLLNCSSDRLAQFLYGDELAPAIKQAWSFFSEAFEKYYPVDYTSTMYYAPQNFGPMSLLYENPTGRHATMIGFPYDDINGWRGNIPVELFHKSFSLLAEGWTRGVQLLYSLPKPADSRLKANLDELITVADACRSHFQSTVNQINFVLVRNAGRLDGDVIAKEREEALCLLELSRKDSRLGYEASNHYFYTENDLLEKVIDCDYLKGIAEMRYAK